MQRYLTGLALVFVITLVSVLSVRTSDPALGALAVVAALAVAVRLSGPDPAGLAMLNPAWTVALLVRREIGATELLPAWAVQAVAGLAAGLVAGPVADRLPQLGVVAQPDLLAACVLLGAAGVVGTWVALAGREPLLVAAPVLLAAALLSTPFAGALNPAVLFGTGVADVAEWTYVFAGSVILLVAGVLTALIRQPTRDG